MSLENHRWNIEQCNRCHQCKASPVQASKKFSPLCPAIEYGQFHAYSGSGKIITAYALMKGRVQYTPDALESITTCSMCGACDTACRFQLGDLVQPLEGIYDLREKMFVDGQVPVEQRAMLESIEKNGNRFGQPREARTRWAEGLDLTDATTAKVDVLLHIGCANAYDEAQWPGLVGTVAAMRGAGVSFGTLGARESHAGALAFELGDRDLARRCAEDMIAMARASGADTLVTCDAESLAAFRNFYPRLGLSLDPVQVLHVSEYLDALASEPAAASKKGKGEIVTYHDPCRLGRLSEPYVAWDGEWQAVRNGLRVAVPPVPERFGLGGVYDAPRRLLQSVPGVTLVEMERKREFSYCCGAGAGGAEAHPEFAEKAALDRLEEAVSTGASTLVTSCGTCSRHMNTIAEKHGVGIKVRDLAGFVAAAKA